MSRLAYCLLLLIAFGGSTHLASAPLEAPSIDPVQTSPTPPDTLPDFRYDLGVASGYSQITNDNQDTDRYIAFSLLPELYYGQLGIGLLARLHIQPRTATLREENFDTVRDYLALLYFVEYGQETDSTGHARLGSLEEVSLGYGHFVDRYTNAISLDDPMRGLTGAAYGETVRVEGVYGDLARLGVFGLHASYLPFGRDPTAPLPRVQVGVSIAGDLDDEGSEVNPDTPGQPFLLREAPADRPNTDVPVGVEDGALIMVGLDAGIRLFRTETLSLVSFVEASKMVDHGIGASLGIRGTSVVGPLEVRGQYEQLFLGSEFLPNYFGSTYEAQRIRSVALPMGEGQDAVDAVDTKRNRLLGRKNTAYGYLMRVGVDYRETVETTIGYQTILGEEEGDEFTFDFRLFSSQVPFTLRLGYDRFNIDRWADIFVPTRDDALYRLGVAYQIIPPLRLGVEVRQTYEPVYREGRTVGRTKQNRFSPFLQFTLRL